MASDEEMREILRRACGKAGGQTAWADQHGVKQQAVSFILSGERNVSVSIGIKLGYEKAVDWRKVKRSTE